MHYKDYYPDKKLESGLEQPGSRPAECCEVPRRLVSKKKKKEGKGNGQDLRWLMLIHRSLKEKE